MHTTIEILTPTPRGTQLLFKIPDNPGPEIISMLEKNLEQMGFADRFRFRFRDGKVQVRRNVKGLNFGGQNWTLLIREKRMPLNGQYRGSMIHI